MKTSLDVLKKTRQLLSDPSKWTKHVGAKNADGEKVNVNDTSAVKWCLYGALVKTSDGFLDIVVETEKALAKTIKITNPLSSDYISFNDNPFTTHADLLAFLDESIKLAERQANQ